MASGWRSGLPGFGTEVAQCGMFNNVCLSHAGLPPVADDFLCYSTHYLESELPYSALPPAVHQRSQLGPTPRLADRTLTERQPRESDVQPCKVAAWVRTCIPRALQ